MPKCVVLDPKMTENDIVSNFYKQNKEDDDVENYVFTNDLNFAIKPLRPTFFITDEDLVIPYQSESEYLFINTKYHDKLDSTSPLKKFIENGLIIKASNTTIPINTQKNFKKTKKTNAKKTTAVERYYKYKFYKTLTDKREYNVNTVIDTEENHAKINENDCLKFSECLTYVDQTNTMTNLEDMLIASENPPVLRSKVSKVKFGEHSDEEKNATILNDIDAKHKNHHAIPKMGESYGIVVKPKTKYEGPPYHIAFVLYTNNDVNITLEAFADRKDKYLPRFGFYDTNPNGYTFHRYYSGEIYAIDYYAVTREYYRETDKLKRKWLKTNKEYYKKLYCTSILNAETIVLESIPTHTILKEYTKVTKPDTSTKNRKKNPSTNKTRKTHRKK
jgi:hypothetical protein